MFKLISDNQQAKAMIGEPLKFEQKQPTRL